MKDASFYDKLIDNNVQCRLCPHLCKITEGKRGSCGVRKNIKGQLVAETYGRICSAGFDPIEKKPLYHFYPGRDIFSVGSIGCNLHCKFCQNWEISQSTIDNFNYLKDYSASGLVRIADKKSGNLGIAYTYNEPTVWYELMLDMAKEASSLGFKNAMVTNGFINAEPLQELLPFMDAFSVDLKAFHDDFYRKLTSSRLEPVKETLKTLGKSNRHFEITNLVVTGENDNESTFTEMVKWIAGELGPGTVLHISRYYPTYKMTNDPTPVSTLQNYCDIASEHLSYIYLGNVSTERGQNTRCPKCGELVIERMRYHTRIVNLDSKGKCGKCGEGIVIC